MTFGLGIKFLVSQFLPSQYPVAMALLLFVILFHLILFSFYFILFSLYSFSLLYPPHPTLASSQNYHVFFLYTTEDTK